ncbi:uncharacterized protein kl isoform X4 [Stigmatopora argus]
MIDGASERGRPRKWPPPRPRSPEPGLNVKTSTGNGAPGLCPGGPRPAVPLAGRHRRPGLCRAGRRGPADVGPLRQAALPGRQSLPERHFPTGLHVGGGHGRLPGGGRVRQGRKGAVHLGHLHARRQARGQGRRGQRQLPQRGGRRARPAPAGRGPLPLLAVVAADLPRRHPRQPQPGGRALLPRAAGAAEGGRRGAGGHALPLGPARGAAAAAGRLEPPADGPALPRLRRLLLPGLRRARQVVDHHRQPLRRGPPRLRHRGAGAGHQGGPRPALPGGACAAAGSRGGVAHLRPRLPAAPRRPRVDGAGLALGAPQPHPPGEPARVPVLPGARAGLVRLAALRRRRLPGLHEGPPGRPPAGPRRRRAAAAAGGRRLLRPVSQRRAQLPAGQRQPQVRSAGGPGPAHAALLGQRRVRPARHLRGAERMVRVGQHQDPGPQAHVLLEEVHRRGPEIRGGGRREVAGLHGVVSDGRLRVAPRVRHPAGPLLRGLQHTRHEAGAQDLGRLLQVGAPGGGRRRRARSDNGETCWRLFPGRRNVIRRNGFPELPENRPARGVFPCDFAWGVSANSIQVESSPSQFADRNVYTWNVDNGELTRLEGPPAPPSAREAHCADYVSIGQQLCFLCVAARGGRNPGGGREPFPLLPQLVGAGADGRGGAAQRHPAGLLPLLQPPAAARQRDARGHPVAPHAARQQPAGARGRGQPMARRGDSGLVRRLRPPVLPRAGPARQDVDHLERAQRRDGELPGSSPDAASPRAGLARLRPGFQGRSGRAGLAGPAHGLGGTGLLLQPRRRGTGQAGPGLPGGVVRPARLRRRRLSSGNAELAATAQLAGTSGVQGGGPLAGPRHLRLLRHQPL